MQKGDLERDQREACEDWYQNEETQGVSRIRIVPDRPQSSLSSSMSLPDDSSCPMRYLRMANKPARARTPTRSS